ncbi:MAG: YkgJ family cysteine cluster protein [Rhodospirillaceae bacterium]|nr:YkgJ family cysteine cluster protein [Rhodospirillales bacterium]
MNRRFACTACGKCCFGWLPLTLTDALAHADLFPLGLVWSPVRQGHKAFALTARLGTTIRLPDRRELAIRIVPTAYIPPSLPCPALGADALCSIQAAKPSRCRTMPFFPYREERDQADLLVPRKGWACDVSDAAPVVYGGKTIVAREDFDRERHDLLTQAPVLKAYADAMVRTVPGLLEGLVRAVAKPVGGDVLLSFATLLPRLDGVDAGQVAQQQLPVLEDFTARTAGLADYPERYGEWRRDMARLARKKTADQPTPSTEG